MINGGHRLNGTVSITGAKNAAVAIIAAAALVDGVCRIENIPKINDVTLQLEILKSMNAKVRLINSNTIEIDCSNLKNNNAAYNLFRKSRASYYLLGAMLGRYGKAEIALPGGCDFGVRPIDQHIKGMETLGATIETKNGFIHADAKSGLKAGNVYFDVVSVGATINVMLAAVLADGQTYIENAAKEPHIVDVANFLNSMGACVSGAGTDVIKIKGVKRLCGGSYAIIPDQIEAGTYMAAVTAVGGDVLIKNVIPKHLECIAAKLTEMGAEIEEFDDMVRIKRNGSVERTNVKTLPYPGFPTDMQPQICAALCFAKGASIVTEGIWDNRYRYIEELKRMGAYITVDGRVAIIEGKGQLSGAAVKACDLRAGAALVIAGLAAEGTTEVEGIEYIERGYEDIVEKLSGLGASIKYVEIPENIEEYVERNA